MVSNRTDMHNAVRNATELLTQEIGQAGRIALPGKVTLAANALKGTNVLTINSTAANANTPATSGIFLGEILLVGADDSQESVVVQALTSTTLTLTDTLANDHIDTIIFLVQCLAGALHAVADYSYRFIFQNLLCFAEWKFFPCNYVFFHSAEIELCHVYLF